jgi:hypothetical protein
MHSAIVVIDPHGADDQWMGFVATIRENLVSPLDEQQGVRELAASRSTVPMIPRMP